MKRGAGGFSLAELLVVITIITVLVTGSISLLGVFARGQGLRQAGRIVGAQFMNARQRATSEKCVYFVVFDTGRNAMRLYRDADPAGPAGPDRVLALGGPDADVWDGGEVPLPAHVEFACGQGWAEGIDGKSMLSTTPFDTGSATFAIAFYPDGTCVLPGPEVSWSPDGGGSSDLILVQNGQRARVYLDINTAAGKVRRIAFRAE